MQKTATSDRLQRIECVTFILIFFLSFTGTGGSLFGQDCHSNVHIEKTKKKEGIRDSSNILFEDSMMSNWQKNWFLDGQKATVEHRDHGLYFSAGTITKSEDPVAYHAHHAVLWTRQVFEGDILISYEMTRVDSSDYGTTLLYIQAQGTGIGPYSKDIAKWSELRKIPAMSLYFENMNLISLSFRENLRCKRYPWVDPNGNRYPNGGLIKPMLDYPRILPGNSYRVVVEKRAGSVTLRLYDAKNKELLTDYTWDTTQVPEELQPITKGRIGLRHMSTRQFIYRNFKVERLPAAIN